MWKRLKIPTTPSHRCTNGFSKLRIQVLTVSQGLQQTLPLRICLLLSYWYQWMTLFVFDWQGSFLEYPVTWMITNKIGWIMICQNIYKNIYTYIYIHTYMYYCIHVFSSIFTRYSSAPPPGPTFFKYNPINIYSYTLLVIKKTILHKSCKWKKMQKLQKHRENQKNQ